MSYYKGLDHRVLEYFLALPMPEDKIQVEYIWIGANNDIRSKTRTLNFIPKDPSEIPEWNFDASSTKQAPGDDSEIILKPKRIFKDPFRREKNILVLCECYDRHNNPIPSNTRFQAMKIFERCKDAELLFGIEQEYVLYTMGKDPVGWPKGGYPRPEGPYYCGVGGENAIGRELAEVHLKMCLYAGIKMFGINSERLPGSWEYQIGPLPGEEIGDHCWMARYILQKVGEYYSIRISYNPKPISGWSGQGCHVNVSTKETRSENGIEEIYNLLKKLSKKHEEHIKIYGEGNEKRLIGTHGTCTIDTFTYAVASRVCSVRIPSEVERNKKGYFEDRRPAANADPYVITSKIAETILLD